MTKIYRTIDGDELDQICFEYYGYSNGSVEAVLFANKDLAKKLPFLEAGINITLPDLAQPVKNTVRLWD
tara:strand:- start:2625 stop:2831 length:207 start_codon:yes stop_codon:yes gene_type:complete